MSQTDTRACAALAEQIFDRIATQFGDHKVGGYPGTYFSQCSQGEPTLSYLSKVAKTQSSRSGMTGFAFAGGVDQVAAVTALWEEQRDGLLLSLAPSLRELAKSIGSAPEEDDDEQVSIFCYTMY